MRVAYGAAIVHGARSKTLNSLPMQNTFKAACLAIYLASLVGAVWPFPGVTLVHYLVLGLLAIHALELLAVLRLLRQQPGALIDGITLTLLFGLLHWSQLAKRPPVKD